MLGHQLQLGDLGRLLARRLNLQKDGLPVGAQAIAVGIALGQAHLVQQGVGLVLIEIRVGAGVLWLENGRHGGDGGLPRLGRTRPDDLVDLLSVDGVGECDAETIVSNEVTELNTDYPDALPVATQLSLGSLQLEESEWAIDEEQAAQLLPLWQAYQTLSTSDKAAEAEVTALVNQIQDSMTAEQIEAIAGMALTAENVTEIMQELAGQFGRGAIMGGEGEDAQSGGGRPGGGMGQMGGFPGGGMPGGMPGMGGLGQAGADARATRIAEMGGDADDIASLFMNQAAVNSLIRMLQAKTGEIDLTAGRMNLMIWEIISDTVGVSLETLQEEAAEGDTLAEIIAAHGGDLEAVAAALKEAYIDAGREEADLDQRIDDLLNNSFPQFNPDAASEQE